jgi:hypothetical protein
MSAIVFKSSEEENEFNALLQRLSPGIADFILRMIKIAPQTWEEAKSYRDEIVELNRTAQTDEEQVVLLFAFNALMDQVAERDLVDATSLEQLRRVREADYKSMLSVQAMLGDRIDPDRLQYVTRREVAAGRLAADDKFRKLAVDGATALGNSPHATKGVNWLRRLWLRRQFRKS